MGLPAHDRRGAQSDNPPTDAAAAPTDDLTMLETEIRALLDAPADGEAAPCVDRLEHALTSGYARALELEAESLRLDRRIGEVVGLAPSDMDRVTELAELVARRSAAQTHYTHLRALLDRLRDRAAAARVAATI